MFSQAHKLIVAPILPLGGSGPPVVGDGVGGDGVAEIYINYRRVHGESCYY